VSVFVIRPTLIVDLLDDVVAEAAATMIAVAATMTRAAAMSDTRRGGKRPYG
jgi:hypothetical protein